MEERIRELNQKIHAGSGKAALTLAESYKWGLYGEVDFTKAARLYRLCAKSRSKALSSAGYYNLGVLYYHGYLGDEPDIKRAFSCFMKSALLSPNAAALGKLADMYRYGQFVEQNEEVALSLYTKAART